MENSKSRIVLFLGAGFSAQSGFPSTGELNQQLLATPADSPEPRIETFISESIGKFWGQVFAWKRGMKEPSLEGHFTQIDMATKSYHNLGPAYDPRKLHAIRRMTIHRIWAKIKRPRSPFPDACVSELLTRLTREFEVVIITTNWDDHVEWILDAQCTPFNYGVEEVTAAGMPIEREGNISLLKLHGSTNTGYCDCCQSLTRLDYGFEQAVVRLKLLLDPDDFRLLGAHPELTDLLRNNPKRDSLAACGVCRTRLGTRIATFTYRKDLEEHQAVWAAARTGLQLANKWLFVGYSMPEADVEVRHLLKSTQLARREPPTPLIDVVLKKDCAAGTRYQRFFGLPTGKVFQDGTERWVATHLLEYCR
jgi:hypothetical protein